MTTLPEEAAKAAAQKDYEARILSALEPSANACPCTKIQQDETCPVGYPSLLCEICDGKGVVQPSSARELALEEAAKNCEREAAEVEGLIDDVAYHLRKRAAAIRALSSPDHADAGKVEGDGWMQKASELYDRCKLWPETSAEGFTALLQLRYHVAEILPSAPASEGAE